MFEITVHNWLVFRSLIGSSVFKIKSKAYLKAKRIPLNKLLKKDLYFWVLSAQSIGVAWLVKPAWALTSPNPSPDFARTTGQAEKKQLTPNWGSVWSLRLREPDYAHAPEVKGLWTGGFDRTEVRPGYGMLMSPNKARETAVHGCHCPCDMVVCMRVVLAGPRVAVGVSFCFYVCLKLLIDGV